MVKRSVRTIVHRSFHPFALILVMALLPGPACPPATDGLARPAIPAAFHWAIECVDCPHAVGLSDRSLKVDPAGYPHLAYGGDGLYYAWHDGARWQYETVDRTAYAGGYVSLVLDAAGYPHISYYARSLKYAYKDAAGWHTELLEGAWNVGLYCSLALDAGGYAHITYLDRGNRDLKYAYQDAAGWHVTILDEQNAWDSSLALGPDGKIHVAYRSSGELRYGYQDATGWHSEILGDGYGLNPSLAVDAGGRPHVALGGNDLRYATRDPDGAWQVENVAPFTTVYESSLALDADGRPRIAFPSTYPDVLNYAWRDDAGSPAWHIEVAVEEVTSYGTSLAIGADGRPAIAYVDHTQRLMVARQDASGWQTDLVDANSDAGRSVSLALDGQGRLHLAYLDGYPNHDLKAAARGPAGWETEVVDRAGQIGWFSSMAIDPVGAIHIGYTTLDSRELRYARRDAGSQTWVTETVYYLGSDLSGVSLALDAKDQPHIAIPDGNLDYASRYVGSPWQVETVGGVGDLHSSASLALDARGYPHVIARDISGYELKYIYRDADGWHVEAIDPARDQHSNSSLALDASGCPNVAYYDWDSRDLKLARRDPGGAWHIETVDSSATSGGGSRNISLVLDAQGQPHIAYYYCGPTAPCRKNELRYARRSATGWQIQTVTTDLNELASDLSLALDAADRPYIGYHDYFQGDLKVATLVAGYSIYLPLVLHAH